MRPPQPSRCPLEFSIGPVLQELVMAAMHDDQVRLIPQHLLQNRQHPITGVGDPAAVDDVPVSRRLGRVQAKFQPLRERGLGGPRIPLHRRVADAEDAKLARLFPHRERLRIEMRPFRPSDFISLTRVIQLEQRTHRAEADERIIVPIRPAQPKRSQSQLDHKKRQQPQYHRQPAKQQCSPPPR